MTNEEAIKELSVLWERMKRAKESGVLAYKTIMFYDGQYVESLEVAIKALEQQPCEDAISREAVLNLFNKSDEYRWETAWIRRKIEKLPSVIPKGVTITDFADRCRECGKQKVEKENE